MSSHHIVRDEQEPALIISDFSGRQQEDIGQLLEWSPTVVALEEALPDLLTMGIKVDVAVISSEKLSYWQEELSFQQPIRFYTSDEASYEKFIGTISQLRKENYRTFHILSNRLNLFDFINLYNYFRGSAELIYFNEAQKIIVSPVGNYRKWLRKDQEIAVFPLSESTYIRTSGFVSNPDNEMLHSELHLMTAEEGLVTIDTNLKPLIISEQL